MSGKVTKLPSGPWLVAVVSVRQGEQSAPYYCFLRPQDLGAYNDPNMTTLTAFMADMIPDFAGAAEVKHKLGVKVRSMTRRQLNRLVWEVEEAGDDGDGA